MLTIGVLGGMGWPSTLVYYRLLNEEVGRRLGGQNAARCILLSVNFAEIESLQASGDWVTAADLLAKETRKLEAAGIDILLLATNTMHRVADAIQAATSARFLHIADALADVAAQRGLLRIGVLGTRHTMEGDFFCGRLAERGFNPLIPEADDRDLVHRTIYEELVHNRVSETSRQAFLDVIGRLQQRGAEAVALACTEIMLLVSDGDAAIPLLDTTKLHCHRAVELALG